MFFCKQKSQFHTNYFRAEKHRKYRYYRYFFLDIDIRYFFQHRNTLFQSAQKIWDIINRIIKDNIQD